jgi:site-specific recombinase XerD
VYRAPVRVRAQAERDAALVALAYAGGFRRAELVALDLADHDGEAGRLRVIGKGNKERAVFIGNGGGPRVRSEDAPAVPTPDGSLTGA